jgi:hypothetical protein
MPNCWRYGAGNPPRRGPGSGESSASRPQGGTSYSQLTVGMAISASGPEFLSRAGALALPPLKARNDACHCGCGSKYKRCCYEQDEVVRRQLRSASLPPWILSSRGKLHQFEKYVCNVFALPALLARLNDTRRAPEISTFEVVNSLLHSALLRIPSLNALEGDLKESDFQKLIGRKPTPEVKAGKTNSRADSDGYGRRPSSSRWGNAGNIFFRKAG